MTEMLMAREAYGDLLVELGTENKNIFVLDADLSSSTKTSKFAKKFPQRFINCGIAEQNMINVAAGLAVAGKTPFVSTFAIFGSGRAWEQIRNTLAVGKLNVKIVVTHGGISVGPDGVSHQSLEDIALMRTIPEMKVLVPCDAPEAVAAIRAAAEISGPVYVRLGRPKVPTIWKETRFTIGKAQLVNQGNDVSIVACGIMVNEALNAAKILSIKGISAEVINMGTIKPLDGDILLTSLRKTGCVVTCEEHSVIGGLGSAVAEFLSQNHPVPQYFIGIKDRFGQSGDPEDLMVEYQLTAEDIAAAAEVVMKKK
ncbi:MAG: transketolase family protein [Candidatus Omnitrophica bacterium]|nr:transketolase family protein [Candidatus Omnitrophota bacterium]